MALAIATNNAALNAAASASSVNRDMETSMARLSSGKRINSASDDAAGVAISSRLSAEIRGTDQSIRNALDGQALIDTAEGAHKEIENILQRMREVSVQAANDTNNDQDRQNLQAEMNALITEIDRIAGTTTWAGEKLMESESGSFFSFQVGAATGEKNQIDVTIDGMGANILGFATPPADGTLYTPDGNTYEGATHTMDGVTMSGATHSSDSVTLTTSPPAATGDPIASISGDTLTVNGTAAAAGNLVLSFNSGADITVSLTGDETTAEIAAAIAGAVASVASDDAVNDNLDGTVSFSLEDGDGDYSSATTVTISGDTTVAQAIVGVPTAPVTSVANADDARVTIKAIDEAIKTVNIQRSKLGAVSNRLSHTVNNLTNISSNLSAAQGGIEDADFAHETTMLAKNQILQQASTAMLAQANASKQNVLSLLQG
jgi:flagellin